jgi:23S rRNA pseudouridine2605 synthase
MRINKYLAQATGMSRRAADVIVSQGRVTINATPAQPGSEVTESDQILLDGQPVVMTANKTTIMLNKPVGYVVSREGQGSQTIYDLLPAEYHTLKPVGRLDKDSSGLLLLTDDGELANQLTHPRYAKTKVYEIKLDKPLAPLHQQMINDHGIQLEDGLSQLHLEKLDDNGRSWRVTMAEGRNRQIRRTFASLDYEVISLNRVVFGTYKIDGLEVGGYREV